MRILLCMFSLLLGAVAANAEVRLLDANGKPVVGARLSYVQNSVDGTKWPSVVTGPNGNFKLTWAPFSPPAKGAAKEPARPINCVVELPSGAVSAVTVKPDDREVRLPEGAPFACRFEGPDGKPVAGCAVSLSLLTTGTPGDRTSWRWYSLGEGAAKRVGVKTDASGVARFRSLPKGFKVRVTVLDQRYAQIPYYEGDTVGAQGVPMPVQKLVFGGSIQCVVTKPDGKPVAGVRIVARSSSQTGGTGMATTGADGKSIIPQLASGRYSLELYLGNDLAKNWTANIHPEVVVQEGEVTRGIRIGLSQGILVKLTVRTVAGKPVPSAGVTGPQAYEVFTDEAGRVDVRVPAGHRTLNVVSAGPRNFWSATFSASVDGAVGETKEVTIVVPDELLLPLPPPAHGIVVDASGAPVEGAVVTPVFSEMPFHQEVRTNAKGAFAFDQQANAGGFLRATRGNLVTLKEVPVGADGSATLTLHENKGAISGVVVGDDGKPIQGAMVALVLWGAQFGVDIDSQATDATGAYRFVGIFPNCRYTLRGSASGHADAYADNFTSALDVPIECPPLRLYLADRAVQGVVVDDKGNPVEGARVDSHGARDHEVLSGKDGSFTLTHLSRGEDYLVAESDRQRGSITLNPGATTCKIVVHSTDLSPSASGKAAKRSALTGKVAPALSAKKWINSKPLSLADLRGNLVVLDFWATTCGPCVGSLPGVQKLYDSFHDRGVVVIGVHPSQTNDKEQSDFLAKHPLTYPLLVDNATEFSLSWGVTFSRYGIDGIPQAVLIGKDGTVLLVGDIETVANVVATLADPPKKP